LRAINYFDIKGFINTLSAVSSGNGDIHITNSCEGKLGSELIIDDFKISTGGGESQVSSNICIGSTESANQKVGTLVIGKNDPPLPLETALRVLMKPLISK
jgi:hypothetical protein